MPIFWQKQSAGLEAMLKSLALDRLVGPLLNAGATEALNHSLRQSTDVHGFTRHMHTWFDAFRTLKLIHNLRDHHYPSVSFEALAKKEHLVQLLHLEPELSRLHVELCAADPL